MALERRALTDAYSRRSSPLAVAVVIYAFGVDAQQLGGRSKAAAGDKCQWGRENEKLRQRQWRRRRLFRVNNEHVSCPRSNPPTVQPIDHEGRFIELPMMPASHIYYQTTCSRRWCSTRQSTLDTATVVVCYRRGGRAQQCRAESTQWKTPVPLTSSSGGRSTQQPLPRRPIRRWFRLVHTTQQQVLACPIGTTRTAPLQRADGWLWQAGWSVRALWVHACARTSHPASYWASERAVLTPTWRGGRTRRFAESGPAGHQRLSVSV